MSACVKELNDVIANFDNETIYLIINYAKNFVKNKEKNINNRIGIAADKMLYKPGLDFHEHDEEIAMEFGI